MQEFCRKEFEDFCQQVDQRIRALGDRIGDIDRKFAEKIKVLDDLSKTKDDWKPYINKANVLICEKAEVCKSSIDNCINEVGKIRSYSFDKAKELEHLKSDLADVKRNLEDIHKNFYSHRDSALTVHKQVENISMLSEKTSETLKAKDSEYNKSIRDLFETIFSTKREIQDLSLKIHQSNALYNKADTDILQLSKSIEISKERLEDIYKELLTEIKANKDTLVGMINVELEDLFIPDVSHFVNESEVQKLRHEVDLCNLDSKNACVKSSNLEMQSAIHGKKIESLQLKINQLELKNQ